MPYKVEYLESVVTKDIPELPKQIRLLVYRAITDRLAVDPLSFGKPLRYDLQGLRSLRVSVYRILYRIELETNTILIVAIDHRKDAYKY